MKKYEKECIEYSSKFKANWEYHCIAKDSWLAGYQQCRENLIKELAGSAPYDLVPIKQFVELVEDIGAEETKL